MIFRRIAVGPMQANCYILGDELTRKAVIIDPGADAAEISSVLARLHLTAQMVINTHGHFDHIGADLEFNAPIYIHKKDADFLKNENKNFSDRMGCPFKISSADIRILEDKEIIKVGEIVLEVMHTPGHTPGGICLLLKGLEPQVLFSGDTLFKGGIGRTDLPDACEEVLLESIKNKILKLPDDTIIHPGHGPESEIGIERRENPFLMSA